MYVCMCEREKSLKCQVNSNSLLKLVMCVARDPCTCFSFDTCHCMQQLLQPCVQEILAHNNNYIIWPKKIWWCGRGKKI